MDERWASNLAPEGGVYNIPFFLLFGTADSRGMKFKFPLRSVNILRLTFAIFI